MTRAPLLLTAAALLAAPALAHGHSATIACDATAPSGYAVVPDYLHLDPAVTYTPTGVTVVWRDRYTVSLPYPAGCVVPPAPVEPPAPPNPTWAPPPDAKSEAPPLGTPAPPVVTPGAPVEPQPRVRPRPKKAVRVTCKLLNQRRAGVREYTKRGFYFRCKAPVPPRKGKPFTPAVSG